MVENYAQYKLKSFASLLCVVVLFNKYIVNPESNYIDKAIDEKSVAVCNIPEANLRVEKVLDKPVAVVVSKADISKPKDVFKAKLVIPLTKKQRKKYLKEIKSSDVSYNYKIIEETIDLALRCLSDSDIGGKQFLKEIAITESRLGSDPNHIRYNGRAGRGVWQIDEIAFKETKNIKSHPILKIYHENLLKAGIDWQKVEWNDCNKLLYGAIAARLLMLCKPFKISVYRAERAKQWKEHYNSHLGKGSVEKYLQVVSEVYAMID